MKANSSKETCDSNFSPKLKNKRLSLKKKDTKKLIFYGSSKQNRKNEKNQLYQKTWKCLQGGQ